MFNMNEMYEACQSFCYDKPFECKKTAKHYLDVTVPVSIKPDADVGEIEVECCGEPVVRCSDDKKPGKDTCRLYIVQKIAVKIPVIYKLCTDVGESMTDCCGKCDK